MFDARGEGEVQVRHHEEDLGGGNHELGKELRAKEDPPLR